MTSFQPLERFRILNLLLLTYRLSAKGKNFHQGLGGTIWQVETLAG
jgi:hypothetical protein